MNTVFVILILAAMIMVVVSLVRGVVAFLQSTKIDLQSGEQVDATEMQLKQNKAMMARVKWQAVAIVIMAIMLAVAA
ncbi:MULTISPECIES: HIG1 domain-containing protein [Qipengyuania]|uniref:Hypoxia induced protein conserved region n=1 Tax=Qipengyuania nanhaisediminis TaxID=604088 RepID=A0A1I5L4G9_9SPHN|nr:MULTISPECIES: HIG1 domain-containing protein [Qipengyuania]MBX7513762.1 HIG1 domain-containing protein [Qipengyuania intermedia]MCA0903646.1 HIG1 domain-containing protein [Qipengyuania aquimaris]SFO92073.1 Hypoxia induced protein conserved region [Qipengyuania nanhaisediminis]